MQAYFNYFGIGRDNRLTSRVNLLSSGAALFNQSFSSQFELNTTFSHLVKITETQSGVVISTKQFIWCGNQRCEVRDANSNLTNQYFSYGQVNYSGSTATNYYYTFEYFGDHLGSIRELVDTSGNIKAQYIYSPYGVVTKVAGSTGIDSDFQYASYYYHAPSGLNLTMYRAYSASLGRWLTRDPVGYSAVVNLYAYVGGESVAGVDPLLLQWATAAGTDVAPGIGTSIGLGMDIGLGIGAGLGAAGLGSLAGSLYNNLTSNSSSINTGIGSLDFVQHGPNNQKNEWNTKASN